MVNCQALQDALTHIRKIPAIRINCAKRRRYQTVRISKHCTDYPASSIDGLG
jgi:hypothetical protein